MKKSSVIIVGILTFFLLIPVGSFAQENQSSKKETKESFLEGVGEGVKGVGEGLVEIGEDVATQSWEQIECLGEKAGLEAELFDPVQFLTFEDTLNSFLDIFENDCYRDTIWQMEDELEKIHREARQILQKECGEETRKKTGDTREEKEKDRSDSEEEAEKYRNELGRTKERYQFLVKAISNLRKYGNKEKISSEDEEALGLSHKLIKDNEGGEGWSVYFGGVKIKSDTKIFYGSGNLKAVSYTHLTLPTIYSV